MMNEQTSQNDFKKMIRSNETHFPNEEIWNLELYYISVEKNGFQP